MNLDHVDLLLGVEWFKTNDVHIDWKARMLSFLNVDNPISIQCDVVHPSQEPFVTVIQLGNIENKLL